MCRRGCRGTAWKQGQQSVVTAAVQTGTVVAWTGAKFLLRRSYMPMCEGPPLSQSEGCHNEAL